MVQLYGQETPEFCKWVKEHFGVRVFKAIALPKSQNPIPSFTSISEEFDVYKGSVDAILLDTFDPVGGGLHAGNVTQPLVDYQPDGVDGWSGVETDGVKDITKIATFAEVVFR